MIWGDCIVEIIKPIVRLDYDEILAKTSIELYKDISVNFNHITDTEIGKVLDVYADEKDPNLVIARMFIKDEVWEKYGDKFGGCSVEVAFNPEGTVVIPTQVSILSYDVPPAIEDTNRFTLEKYSKDDKQYIKAYYSWDEQNKKEEMSMINKIYNMLKEVLSSKVEENDEVCESDELENDNGDIMSEERYSEIMSKIEGLEKKYSESIKEKEEMSVKYSEEVEKMKSEYSEVITKYKEELDAVKSEIEVIKSEYASKSEELENELKTLKEKYGLVDSEEIEQKKEYSNKIVFNMW